MHRMDHAPPLVEDVTPKPPAPTRWQRIKEWHGWAPTLATLSCCGLLAMCIADDTHQRKYAAERCVRAGPAMGIETKHDKDFGCLVKTTSGIWERYYP